MNFTYNATPVGTGWFHYRDTATVSHSYWVYVARLVEGRRLVASTTQGLAFWVDDMPGTWAGPFDSPVSEHDAKPSVHTLMLALRRDGAREVEFESGNRPYLLGNVDGQVIIFEKQPVDGVWHGMAAVKKEGGATVQEPVNVTL